MIKFITSFKSPQFYWHTGYRKISIISIILSFLISFLFLTISSKGSVYIILISIFLDSFGLVALSAYYFFIKSYVPTFFGIAAFIDNFFASHLIKPIIYGFIITRIITRITADRFGYEFSNDQQVPRKMKGPQNNSSQ